MHEFHHYLLQFISYSQQLAESGTPASMQLRSDISNQRTRWHHGGWLSKL